MLIHGGDTRDSFLAYLLSTIPLFSSEDNLGNLLRLRNKGIGKASYSLSGHDKTVSLSVSGLCRLRHFKQRNKEGSSKLGGTGIKNVGGQETNNGNGRGISTFREKNVSPRKENTQRKNF